jgi:acyl carrier protein
MSRISQFQDLSLAAINGPNLCIVSGPKMSVESFEGELQKERIDSLRVNFPRASHSGLMKQVSGTFGQKISASISLNAPQIPYISGLSGTWISDSEATDPGYWAYHLEKPIRFFDGLITLLEHKNYLFVQPGSDRGLPLFLDSHPKKSHAAACVNIMKHPKEPSAELDYFYNRVADIWLHGGVIDWNSYYGDNPGRRVPLPTYPFEKQRFEIKGDPFVVGSHMLAQDRLIHKKEEIADWFYFPGWQQSVLPKPQVKSSGKNWLVLAEAGSISDILIQTLKSQNSSVAVVNRGDVYAEENEQLEFVIDPGDSSHYDSLFKSLAQRDFSPDKIIHLWNVEGEGVIDNDVNLESVTQSQERGLFSLMGIVQALGRQLVSRDIDIEFVTDGLFEVTGGEPALDPLKSTALGAVKIIPLEYPTIHCRCVDIARSKIVSNEEEKLLTLLINEFLSPIDDQVVALRDSYRWVQSFRPERLLQSTSVNPQLREHGVYLILGGFGGMGFSIAGHLAQHYKARLALVGRRGLPPRDNWDGYLSEHDETDGISVKIKAIRQMEAQGADVLCFSADISDESCMKALLDEVKQQYGTINGVIHAAGVIDYDGIIQNRTREQIRTNIASKVEGTLILDKLLEGEILDFMALFSSMGDVLFEEKFGEVGYGAANEFMDAFSYYKRRKDGTYAFTINWNDWKETGMALVAVDHKIPGQKTAADYERILSGGVSRDEGVEVFLRALEYGLPRVAVWTSDLLLHLDRQKMRKGKAETFYQPMEDEATNSPSAENRPDLSVPYEAPQTATQKKLVAVWEQFFGIRPIGILDNFFELGGHSLRAISMVASIHKELNVKIPLNIIFAGPTVAELAQAVDSMSTEAFEEMTHIPDRELYEIPLPILGMWMRNLYQVKDRKPFNVNGEYRLGNVRPEALGRAWQELVKRHETMRTVFCTTRQGERMKVMPFDPERHALEVMDLSKEKNGTAKSPELVRELFRTMFDLETGPVCRAILVLLPDNDSVFVMTMPHILSDAWSRDVMEQELMAIYSAFLEGKENPLPPLNIQYRDFGAWYNRRMKMSKGDELKDFWHQVCRSPLPPSNLPMDFPENRRSGSYRELLLADVADMFRPLTSQEEEHLFGLMISARSVKGAQYRLVLPKDVKDVLDGLSVRADASFFAVMSALFNIFFYHGTGRRETITGTMVSTRTHEAMNRMIGYFMNTIVYRSVVDASLSIKDYIVSVGQTISDALAHREYPLEKLLSELDVSLDTLGALFLNFYKSDSNDSVITDFEARHEPVFHVYFDMDLNIGEFKNGIQIECNYNRELFKKKTIEKIFRDFEAFVRLVGLDPEATINGVKHVGNKT